MKNTDLSPFFDKISKKYAKKPDMLEDLIRENSFEEISRIILDYQKKGKIIHILEAGCGNGALTLKLLRFPNVRITAVDFSQGMLNELRKSIRNEKLSFKRITLIKDDIRTACLKKEGFDLVILVNVLVNFKNLDDVKKAITNLSKAVKTQGTFVLTIKNKNSFTGLAFFINSKLARQIITADVPLKAYDLKLIQSLFIPSDFLISNVHPVKYTENPFKINSNPGNFKNKILRAGRSKKEFFANVAYLNWYFSIKFDISFNLNSAYVVIAEKKRNE